jgi:hypothetical protein
VPSFPDGAGVSPTFRRGRADLGPACRILVEPCSESATPTDGTAARWFFHRQSPFENCTASTSILNFQATKSQRWMPWRQMPMKDVEGCDKPRRVA